MILLGTYSGSYILYSRYMAKGNKTKKSNIQSVHTKPCYESGQLHCVVAWPATLHVIDRCRASNWRGTRRRTFRIFARMLVGFIRTYFVSIGRSYLILSAHTYSSGTCSRDTPHQRTTTISRLASSVLTLTSSLLSLGARTSVRSWNTASTL